jgi:AcrR family transcriptional regulator
MTHTRHFAKDCRWRRRKEARPGEILEAALELFVDKGFTATRLNEVADRAGVSKGTVYLYFDSKEALFQAVIREMLLPQVEQAESMAGSFTGPTNDLLRGMSRFWRDTIINSRHRTVLPREYRQTRFRVDRAHVAARYRARRIPPLQHSLHGARAGGAHGIHGHLGTFPAAIRRSGLRRWRFFRCPSGPGAGGARRGSSVTWTRTNAGGHRRLMLQGAN